jgi:hypothetical protein
MAVVRHKEAIHSGHFMVSNFEAEEDDDDDEENIGVTVSNIGVMVSTGNMGVMMSRYGTVI